MFAPHKFRPLKRIRNQFNKGIATQRAKSQRRFALIMTKLSTVSSLLSLFCSVLDWLTLKTCPRTSASARAPAAPRRQLLHLEDFTCVQMHVHKEKRRRVAH